MYKRMLVPLDGSELAEVVFTYAKELAGRLDIDVILLHVSSPAAHGFVPMHRAYIMQAADIVRCQAQEVRERAGIQPEGKQVEVRGELVVGRPADETLRYSEENDVDLILMATRGRSGVTRWAMGSVADKIVRASKAPVWLVRAGVPDETSYDKWPKITILAPLDGSELAESALPYVEALAKQLDTKPVDVVLLRVCEPPVMPSYYGPELAEVSLDWGNSLQRGMVKVRQVASDYLAGIEERLKDSNISVRSEVLEGKATDVITDYANNNPFSVIAMATHGRAGLSRWVYGSVTEYVVLGISNPVLLIRS
ncbi:universal stress protein [Chloroflexota bacterium]